MPTQEEDIAILMELLATHRQKLVHLLRMLAVGSVSAYLVNDIRAAREDIRRIKTTLREWGVAVEDHPEEAEPEPAAAEPVPPAEISTGDARSLDWLTKLGAQEEESAAIGPGEIAKRQGGAVATGGPVGWMSLGVANPPHLNTRFDGLKPDQPLPVGRRVPFVVWVSSRIESNRSQSSRPFTFAFLDSTKPVVFTVRLRADPDAWTIKIVEPNLIVMPPGVTVQEAEFLVTARQRGREKLYITVEQATGVVVQDIWLTVDAALDTEESRLARWLRAILLGPLHRWFAPRAPLSDAQAPTVAAPLAGVRAADDVDLDSSASLRDQQRPPAALTQSPVSTSSAALAPMFIAAPPPPPAAGGRREVALPLDTREVRRRTVRMTFQQAGHDASAFNVFVSAQLPAGWLYQDYRIPVSGAEIQTATLRLRHELERIVFYQVRESGGARYPFAALDALAVDEMTARQASVPLADVGQQVWSMLFDGPRTPDELRRVAAGLRDLPHGSSLQVVLDNQQFIVPWALLYDLPGPITAETLDWAGFWGYRYRLDVLTPGQYPEPTIADDPIRLQLLFNDSAELRGFTSAQAEFVRQQLSKAHCAVAWGMEGFEQVLRNPGEATLWYCYCHGTHTSGAVQPHALASESALTFSSGQRLRLADLRRMRPARLSSRPLVFVNACEGAAQDAFYYDGFMPFFIEERGARGFIGTEVKAPQFLGHDFALEFLRAFARGQEVGEILWRLRRHYLETHHNILAFNYSLYGLGEVRLAKPLLAAA